MKEGDRVNIRKLPSGNYQIRQMIDGHTYSVTVPFKPSKKEAYQLITEKVNGGVSSNMSFREASEEYINEKAAVLSPSTIRAYRSMRNNLPERFLSLGVRAIDAWDVQKLIDGLASDHSPKYLRNVNGFISAVLGVFSPSTQLSTRFPQTTPNDQYTPSSDDIKTILNAAKGTVYEIPFRLACYGLRRSEICALTMEDLDGCRLVINKALVHGEDGRWYVKPTKTASSTRIVLIDEDLAGLIRSTGTIYDGYPDNLFKALRRIQKANNIPTFGIHRLRHYFATSAHAIGMPDAVVLAMGGWKTDRVMKRVYRHADEQQLIAAQETYRENYLDEFGTVFQEIQ